MSRAFYSDYVRHCLRFYTRHESPKFFRTESDKLNWNACDEVFKTLSDDEKELLYEIYRSADTLADNIYVTSESRDIPQEDIWSLIARIENRIAKKRGIL